jgi:hypothetical protein
MSRVRTVCLLTPKKNGYWALLQRTVRSSFRPQSNRPNGVCLGLNTEELDHLKDYKLNSEDSTTPFNSESTLKVAEHFRADLIYNGLRAAAADGALKQREIDAIAALAKKMGINDEKFQAILGIYKEEEEERQKRIALLFPKSYGEAMKAIDKHYGR